MFPSFRSAILPSVLLVATIASALTACRASGGNAAVPETSIAAVAPKGPSTTPFVFQWTATARPGTVYRLTVYDAAERQLLERETRDTRLDVTPDLQGLAASTPRFLWRVAVLGENGEPLAQTPLVETTLLGR